eukprot:Ihof_evm1s581 gene=Ihof_evmTU1s581
MADKALSRWVGDQLYELVGMQEKMVVQFLLGVAKDAKTADDLIATLIDTDTLPNTPSARSFATELYQRVPHQSNSVSESKLAARQSEKKVKDVYEKNTKYALLMDDAEEEDEGERKRRKKEKKKEKRRLRKKQDESSEEEEGDVAVKEVSPEEEAERQRQRDLEERDKFAERLKEKDKEKTKKLGVNASAEAAIQAAKRRSEMEKEERARMLPLLKKEAREKYLKERKEKKLLELQDDIADESYLFADSSLTSRERKDLEYKKKILSLASDHVKAKEMENVDRYVMPQSYVHEVDGKEVIDKERQADLLKTRYKTT